MDQAMILYSHSDCLYHDTGAHHPERPDRLRAVLHALDEEEFAGLDRREAPLATFDQIARVHPQVHIRAIEAAIPDSGLNFLDEDTVVSPGSWDAALRAAGAVCAAVDDVLSGQSKTAFCAIRPPGHHAEPSRAMGFCLFNNIAIGATHARHFHGLERVAVVDFDVHHGNGTQAMFAHDPGLFYGSAHEWPLYPGTGRAAERGVGNIVNLCLPPMTGSADFRMAVSEELLPALDEFAPQLVMISAGFDAHMSDPLANLNFTDDDYGWITRKLVGLAGRHARGRVISVLEGGYHLDALASAARTHVRELMSGS